MNIVVSGGGTGGHIFPALAIADYFKEKNENLKIIYVGGKYGIEKEIVPKYGYDIVLLDIKGIRRKLTLDNVKRLWKAVLSLKKSRHILIENNINLVISTGGYVAGPITYVAQLMGIKTAIQEQNVSPGITNKVLSKRADFIFCGFKEAMVKFSNKNTIYSGNPIKITDTSENIDKLKKKLDINKNTKVILIVGGSGGSESINKAVMDMLPKMKNDKNIKLIHSTGKDYYEKIVNNIQNNYYENYIPMAFIENMGSYMRLCDLVVGSSGASSIAECNYYKKPIIAIPKAKTAENHQEFNARMIEDSGAGVCILEKDLSGQMLYKTITNLIEDEQKMELMSKNSGNLYKKDSLEIIYNSIMGIKV